MFIDNLSENILYLCRKRGLNYGEAAELCDISERYFGDVVRKKTAPTVVTLEKICNGLKVRPDELLLPANRDGCRQEDRDGTFLAMI